MLSDKIASVTHRYHPVRGVRVKRMADMIEVCWLPKFDKGPDGVDVSSLPLHSADLHSREGALNIGNWAPEFKGLPHLSVHHNIQVRLMHNMPLLKFTPEIPCGMKAWPGDIRDRL